MYPKTQAMIAKKLAQGVFPGVVYQFIEQESETHVLGDAAVLPEKEAMTQQHVFDVASLTKVICTTSVVLRLWEQDKLQIDAPLKQYLPTFANDQITLRHLLTHTSDIQTWIPNRDQLSAFELQKAYLTLQPGENLGKIVKYTDAGTILLGFMLEELLGKSATIIFQEEVLKPIGMTNSQFPPLTANRIVPTQQLADGTVIKGITHDPKARILGEHAGNAGLFTTIDDIHLFMRTYFEGSYLKSATIEWLLQDHTPMQNGKRSLGWDLKEDMFFHTGYTGTFLLIDPRKQQGFAFLSNRVHPVDKREDYKRHRDEIIAQYLSEKRLQNVL